jgi:Divergent InlB B-repeat domain
VNRLINLTFIPFALILLVLASPLSAEDLYARCTLDKLDDEVGYYVGLTIILQFDSDSPNEFVYINYRADGLFEDAEDADLTDSWLFFPGRNEVDYDADFQLPRTAGCSYGHIDAQSFRANSAFDSPTMCWSDASCYLGVTIDPGGVLVGDTSGSYYCGECITLTAWPDDGWDFAGWSGSINSDQPVILVCLNGADKFETAHFVLSPPPPPSPTDPDQCSADWVSGCSPIVVNFANAGYSLTGAGIAGVIRYRRDRHASPHRVDGCRSRRVVPLRGSRSRWKDHERRRTIRYGHAAEKWSIGRQRLYRAR